MVVEVLEVVVQPHKTDKWSHISLCSLCSLSDELVSIMEEEVVEVEGTC